MKNQSPGNPSPIKMKSKERCLAAIAGRPVDRTPVFPLLMFLAADRAGINYRTFATNGSAMADAQLNIKDRFNIDAITACSDAFRISADLGGKMAYPEMAPPHLTEPLVCCPPDIAKLARPDPTTRGSRMADRALAVEQMVKAAGEQCLILGWVDMPFAEACSVCGVSEFMIMMEDDPSAAHHLLGFLTGVVIDFALLQLDSGAPMIGAGDAAASLISAEWYREFALPYERQVCDAIHSRGGLVKLHICGNTKHLLADMVASGADLFNVDHLVDFADAARAYGTAGKCFKGNMNPVADIMQSNVEDCRNKALACIRAAGAGQYMLSAGCEIPAAVSDEVFSGWCESVC